MSLVVSAPGKLVLLGEYAVLHGAPALVAAMDRRVVVEVTPSAEIDLRIDAPDIEIDGGVGVLDPFGSVSWPGLDSAARERLELLAAVVEAVTFALREAGQAWRPANLRLESDALCLLPGGPKLGLGASAAVAVAASAALLRHAGAAELAEPQPLFDLALAAHRRAQGGGSGVDVAASVCGGVVKFVREDEGAATTPLAWPADLALVVLWSGRSAFTAGYVAAVAALAETAPETHRALIGELSELATRGAESFAAGETRAFLTAVDAYESVLARLGAAAGVDIVSMEHQRIGNLVRAEGGVYKPSGAGGGDLGVAFCETAAADELLRSLDRGGLRRLPMTVSREGVRLGRGQ